MSNEQTNTPLANSQASLKAAIFSLFAVIDKIEDMPWAKRALLLLSPLYILGFIINAGFEVAQFYFAKNKNYFRLFKLTESFSYAFIAASIGISILTTTNPYAAFLWYFMGVIGATIALGNAIIMLGHNFYQWIGSPTNSIESKLFSQAIIKSLFHVLLALSTYLTLSIMPGPGGITSVSYQISCAVTVFLTSSAMIWGITSDLFKSKIKTIFNLNPEQVIIKSTAESNHEEITLKAKGITPAKHNNRVHSDTSSFFFRVYRKQVIYQHIANNKLDLAEEYILAEINQKLTILNSIKSPSTKAEIKIAVLMELCQLINSTAYDDSLAQINDWLNSDSAIHQSFFAYTSDTVDLIEAGKVLVNYKLESELLSEQEDFIVHVFI